jgi:hypothetical protein
MKSVLLFPILVAVATLAGLVLALFGAGGCDLIACALLSPALILAGLLLTRAVGALKA